MHQIDLTAARAAKASERKGLAILAYDNACADPEAANWRAVADLLRLAIPATKGAPKASAEAPESRFAAWADYAIPQSASAKRLGKSPVVTVTFACGAVVRAPAVSMPGKPVNIGRGLRIAFAYYRARIARTAGAFARGSDIVAVPSIVSISCDNGAEFDPADCSARTAEARRGTFDAIALAAESAALPEKAPDGAMTRGEFLALHYRIASAEAELSAGADDSAADLAASIEDSRLRLSGVASLEIGARRRAIRKAEAEARRQAEAAEREAALAAEKAAEAAKEAENGAALARWIAEQEATQAPEAAEAEAPRLRLATAEAPAKVHKAEAETACTCPACASPFVWRRASAPACVPIAPAAADRAPAAPPVRPAAAPPRMASRFLASTSLGAPVLRPSVGPHFAARR